MMTAKQTRPQLPVTTHDLQLIREAGFRSGVAARRDGKGRDAINLRIRTRTVVDDAYRVGWEAGWDHHDRLLRVRGET